MLPEAVAENDDLLLLLGWEKAAAKRHTKLGDVEVVAGGGLSPDPLGFAVSASCHRGGKKLVVGSDSGEGFGLLADIAVERPGEMVAAALAACLDVQRQQGSEDRRQARARRTKVLTAEKIVALAAMPSPIERMAAMATPGDFEILRKA